MATIQLTLTFDPGADGVTIHWQADVLGTRRSKLVLPFAGNDLALVSRALDVLQDPYYPTPLTVAQYRHFLFSVAEQQRLRELELWDASGRVTAAAPRIVGRILWQALIADPEGARALGTLRDHAAATEQTPAVSLCLPPEAVELAALPWELLWDEAAAPLLFSRGEAMLCTRHLNLAQAIPPSPRQSGPLRILAVVPQAGLPTEVRQVEQEARLAAWQPLIESGQAIVEAIEPATRLGLLRMLQGMEAPDIVHFFGHGRYGNGSGELLLDDTDDENGSWIDAGVVAALFGGAGLVVLHACQGGAVDTAGAASLLTGVAPALSAAGVPVVIGMQHTVRTAAATQFSAALYAGLAAGRSVQQAVAWARHELYISETDQVSWFVPVVYVRTQSTEPIILRPAELARAVGHDAPTQPHRRPLQRLTARFGGAAHRIRLQATDAAEQEVDADAGSIADAALYAGVAARQQVRAESGGNISDVRIEAL